MKTVRILGNYYMMDCGVIWTTPALVGGGHAEEWIEVTDSDQRSDEAWAVLNAGFTLTPTITDEVLMSALGPCGK